MNRKVRYGLPLVLIALAFSWAILISSKIWDEGASFQFHDMSVVRVEKVLQLKLHRTTRYNVVGGFYVSVYNPKSSCTSKEPNDLFEVRKVKFTTRFLTRFDKKCLQRMHAGKYNVDVTYKVNSRHFTKSTDVIISQKDLTHAVTKK